MRASKRKIAGLRRKLTRLLADLEGEDEELGEETYRLSLAFFPLKKQDGPGP